MAKKIDDLVYPFFDVAHYITRRLAHAHVYSTTVAALVSRAGVETLQSQKEALEIANTYVEILEKADKAFMKSVKDDVAAQEKENESTE